MDYLFFEYDNNSKQKFEILEDPENKLRYIKKEGFYRRIKNFYLVENQYYINEKN
jgi:hypothetical protein